MGYIEDLFEKVTKTPSERREDILKDLNTLIKNAGLASALLALYRQQVKSGFVLSDPLKPGEKEEKTFFDPHTGITFRLQWNPRRELRKNHELLIKRRVIAEHVDETKLINKDKNGKACYLCKTNIALQNPGEILLEVDLAGEKFHLGANFACITNNHFTVMAPEHRPQQYRKEIPRILNEFTDKTEGVFRAAFNGAGYTIDHEHLQATTEEFPLEKINIKKRDTVYEKNGLRVSQPNYYIPVWVVEGEDKIKNGEAADKIIRKWHSLDEENHRENIIAAKAGNLYRTFILLRDRRKPAAEKRGKEGGMAAFESGGNIVLSYQPEPGNKKNRVDERKTFEEANLETVRELLREVSPGKQSYSRLAEMVEGQLP
jgi:hypothetical protein